MSETVYSKEAVDEYFAGLFEILATIMSTLVEAKIEDGASREGAATFDPVQRQLTIAQRPVYGVGEVRLPTHCGHSVAAAEHVFA